MKNKIFAFLLSLISAGCCSQPKIEKVEVLCVSPSINTAIKIDCESFKSVFKEKIKVSKLDKNSIRKMEIHLTKWKPSKKNLEPDVRAQFIIFKTDGSSKVLCYDGGYILSINGHGGKVSKTFAYFLNSIICPSPQLARICQGLTARHTHAFPYSGASMSGSDEGCYSCLGRSNYQRINQHNI